jgi:hypothetical protein
MANGVHAIPTLVEGSSLLRLVCGVYDGRCCCSSNPKRVEAGLPKVLATHSLQVINVATTLSLMLCLQSSCVVLVKLVNGLHVTATLSVRFLACEQMVCGRWLLFVPLHKWICVLSGRVLYLAR